MILTCDPNSRPRAYWRDMFIHICAPILKGRRRKARMDPLCKAIGLAAIA